MEAEALRPFITDLLADVGCEVRDDGAFLWVRVPEELRLRLDFAEQVCLTLDPDRVGEFDAELLAPGSYPLEKLLGLATERGRWDAGRIRGVAADWERPILASSGIPSDAVQEVRVVARREGTLYLFAFRTALTSDEKREAFHVVAVPEDATEGWEVPWPLAEEAVVPGTLPGPPNGLEAAYRTAQAALQDRMHEATEAFRKGALASLEDEVRRIFRYFDGTVQAVRDSAPSGADEVVRVIEAERDRRLAEALERFEPHLVATLCSVRVLLVPMVTVAVRTEAGERELRIDAFTKHVRGLPAAATGDGPAPPRARPRSDTPPRRRRADRAAARAPRESRARSRSGGVSRRAP